MAAGVQPNMNAWGVYKDLGLGKNAYLTGDNWDTDITVTNGPASVSLTTFFTGSNGYRWSGEAWDADMAVLTNPNVNSLGVYYNLTTAKTARWEGETWDTAIDGTANAPSVLSLGTFYDLTTSKGYRWTGKALADDGDSPASVPGVGSYQMVWDGAKWDRMSQPTGGSTATLGDIMGATPTGTASASYTTFYDGTNFRRWLGAVPADNLGIAMAAPYTISLNSFYDGTNFRRWLGAVPADNLGTAMGAPYTLSLGAYYDGTNYRRWTGETWDTTIDTITVAPSTIALNAFYDATTSKGYRWNGGSLTSSIGAPVTGPYVGSIMYGYSSTGPTYYPVKADANGIYVHQADLAPGEDAVNDWKKVRVESVAVYTPGYTDTASVAVAATEVMASVEVLGYSNMSFTCKNTGVTNLIDTTYLYIAPNGSDWQVIATNTTDIAPGATARVFQISNNSDRYMKMMASSNASTTSSRCWLTARVTN